MAANTRKDSPKGRRITIAHVVMSLHVGGLQRVVVNLMRRIDLDRFRSVLCCIEGEGDWVRDVEGYCEAVRVMHKEPGLAYGLAFRLARFFRGQHVDVVHCHNFGSLVYGSIGGRLARSGGIVYTAHGPDIPSKRRQVFFQRLPLADQIVVVSELLRQRAIERVGIKPERVMTVVNGVDAERFAVARGSHQIRSEIGVTDDAPLLGTVARLSPEKDHEMLLGAYARIVSQRPEAKLLIVGDGPLRKNLEIRASALGLKESVRFLGSRQDVAEILGGLDVFILASREEGLPMVVLEAMAAGLPVVATGVGGIPEIVVDGKTGLLVPPGDPDTLADAVIRLITDKKRAESMGHEGMKRVTERFDVAHMIRAYESLYTRLLSSKSQNRIR